MLVGAFVGAKRPRRGQGQGGRKATKADLQQIVNSVNPDGKGVSAPQKPSAPGGRFPWREPTAEEKAGKPSKAGRR